MKTKKTSSVYLRTLRAARIHFLLVLALAATIIVYDASNLMTPDAVLKRWKYYLSLLAVSTIVWLLARTQKHQPGLQKALIGLLVVTDIAVASLLVYADRGMASLAVALYSLPIATAALTYSRSAILASASLSVAAYAFASIKYFADFFNEGYRVQLYGTIGFNSAVFFIIALLLVAIIEEKSSQ